MRAEWTLPWPDVQTNRLWRLGGGRVYLNPKAIAWRDWAIAEIRRSGYQLPKGRLALSIYEYPPAGWHGDTDGIVKLTQDSIFDALGGNDYWVAEVHAYRGAPCATPRIEAVLESVRWRTIDEVKAP